MPTVSVDKKLDLELRECPACGAFVALTSEQWKRREKGQDQYNGFHCPNGHVYGWWEGEADRVRKQLTAAQESNNALTTQKATLIAEKNQLVEKLNESERAKVNLEKRVNAGVCPHCHRTVAQMARHIKTKHGDMPALAVEQ